MKILARMLFLLAIALLGCNRAPNRAGTSVEDAKSMDAEAQDIAEIKALEDRFAIAFRAKDVNAIMQLCVPDDSLVVFDVHPPREVKGPEAYRRDWEDVFSSFAGPLEDDVSEMEVTAGRDVAFVHYIHHVVGATKNGKKADIAVRVTDCLKKVNGVWLIAHSHISVPVDMRTGAGNMQSKP